MFDKLFEAQQKAEEIKKRLDTVYVAGEAEGGMIRVVANGNKRISEIIINPEFFESAEREEIEELLIVAVNKAVEQADQVSQTEMQAATRDMFGGLGDLLGNK